jgi:hypothetical protein
MSALLLFDLARALDADRRREAGRHARATTATAATAASTERSGR